MFNTQLSAAQLMMPFMGEAVKEIADNVTAMKFDAELTAQMAKLGGIVGDRSRTGKDDSLVQPDNCAAPVDPHIVPNHLINGPNTQAAGGLFSAGGTKASEAVPASFPQARVVGRGTEQAAALKVEEKAKFKNLAKVEAVLASLGAPGDVRAACVSMADKDGGLKVQDLMSALKTVAPDSGEQGQGGGKVDGATIRDLLDLVTLPGNNDALKKARNSIKFDDSYTIAGLRQLLTSFVSAVRSQVALNRTAELRTSTRAGKFAAVESMDQDRAIASVDDSKSKIDKLIPSFALPKQAGSRNVLRDESSSDEPDAEDKVRKGYSLPSSFEPASAVARRRRSSGSCPKGFSECARNERGGWRELFTAGIPELLCYEARRSVFRFAERSENRSAVVQVQPPDTRGYSPLITSREILRSPVTGVWARGG